MEHYVGEGETPKAVPKKDTTVGTKLLAELEPLPASNSVTAGAGKKSLSKPLLWLSLLALVALLAGIAVVVVLVVLPGNNTGDGNIDPPPPDRENCEAFPENQFLAVDANSTFTIIAQSCQSVSCPSGLECRADICEEGPCCVQVTTVRNASELADAVAQKAEIIVVEDTGGYELNASLDIQIPTLFVGPGAMVNDIRMAAGNTDPMFSLATCTAVKLESISIVRSGFAATFEGDTTAVQIKNSVIRNPVCGNGWRNIDGFKCAQAIPSLERLSHTSAETFCQDSGGRLLSLTSLRQIELLGTYCPQCNDVWIGGSVIAGPQVSFVNGFSGLEDWMLFEGGEVTEENVGNCVAMGGDVAFLWATRDCLETRKYMCERDIVDAVTTENYGLIAPGSQTTIEADGNLLEVESYASMDLILENARPGDTVRYINADSEVFAIPETLEATVAIQNPSGVTVCEVEAYDVDDNLLEMRGVNGPNEAVLDGDTRTCESDTVWLGVISLAYAQGKLARIVIKNSTLTGATVVVDGRLSTPISTADVDHDIAVTIPKFRIVMLGSFDNSQTVQFASDVSTPTAAAVTTTQIEGGSDFLPRFFQLHRVSALVGTPTDVVTALEVYSYGNNGIARVGLNPLFRECPHVRAQSSPLFSEYRQAGAGIVFERDLTLDLKSDGCRQLSLWTEPSLPVPYQLIVDTPSGQSGNVFVAYPETLLLEETNDVAVGTLIDLRPATEIPRIVTLRAISPEVCVTSIEIRRYGVPLVTSPLPDLATLPVTVVNCLAMCPLFTADVSSETCVRIGTAAVESVVSDIQVNLFKTGCDQIEDIKGGTGRNIEQVCSRFVEFIGSASQMQAEIAASSDYSELIIGIGVTAAPTSSPTSSPTVPNTVAEEIFPDILDEVLVFDLGTLVATQPLRLVLQPSSDSLSTVAIANGALTVSANAVFGFQGLTLDESLSIVVEAGQFAILEGEIECNITCAALNGSCGVEASVLNGTWESDAPLALEYTTVALRGRVDARNALTVQNMVIENENALTVISALKDVEVLESNPLFVPEEGEAEFIVNETEGVDFEISNVSSFALCSTSCDDADSCHGFWYESLEPDDSNREIGICKICFNVQCNRITDGVAEEDEGQAVYLKKEDVFTFIEYPGCLTIEPADIFLAFDTSFQACKAWCSYYLPCRAVTYAGGVCSLYRVDALIDDCGGGGVSPSPVLVPLRGTFGQELRSPYTRVAPADVLVRPDCFRTQALGDIASEEECLTICDANIYCDAFGYFEGFGCGLVSQPSARFVQEPCPVAWSDVPDIAPLPDLLYSVKDQFPQLEYLDLALKCRPSSSFDAIQASRLSECQIQCDIYFACVAFAFSSPLDTTDVNNCILLNAELAEKIYFPGFCDNSTSAYSVYAGFVKTDFVAFDPEIEDLLNVTDLSREEICDTLNTSLVELRNHTDIPTVDDCKAVCTRYTGCVRFAYEQAEETCYIPRPSLLTCALDDVSFKETYPVSCSVASCFQHSTLESAQEACLGLGPVDCGGVVHLGGDLYEIRAPSRIIQMTEDLTPLGSAATTFPYDCLNQFKTLSVSDVNAKLTTLVVVIQFFVPLAQSGFKDGQIGIMPHPVQQTVFNAVVKQEGDFGTSIYRYEEAPTNRVSWLICLSPIVTFAVRTSFVSLTTDDHLTEYRVTVNQGGRVEILVRIDGVEETTNVTTVTFKDRLGLICNDGTDTIELHKNRELVFSAAAVCGTSIESRLFPEIGLVDKLTTVCHVDFSARPIAGDSSQLLLKEQEEAVLFCAGNQTETFEEVREVSEAKADYVHSFDYVSFSNTGVSAAFIDFRFNLTQPQCQKFCDVHFLCSGYAILGISAGPFQNTFCGLFNSQFVTESALFFYDEGALFHYYVSTAVPFRDLYTPVPTGSCFAFRNFENDTEIEGLRDELDCKRQCFQEESCRAFTWDETFSLCTLRVNVDYQTEDCPFTNATEYHFIEALSGFFIGAEDVLFGSTPVRNITFTQDVSLRECETLCTLYGACNSIAHGRLVTGSENQSALVFEDACFLLGKTTSPFASVEGDLNAALREVLVEDVDQASSDFEFFNLFQVYSFTTISSNTRGDFCPDENALIAIVRDTDLFECEALCEAHDDCNSLEFDEETECYLYKSSSFLLSKIGTGIFPCRNELYTITYRVSFQQFVDPTPLYATRKESTSDLCIEGSNFVVENIGTILLCKRRCTEDSCAAGRFLASLQQCVLYSEGFTMEPCKANPQEGQLFVSHGPVEFTARTGKCITSELLNYTFPAKTQEECAAICTEWLDCRTFTLSANGTCTVHTSAEYSDCTDPDTTLYTFFASSNYTRLRPEFCISSTFPLAEIDDTNAEGCKKLCENLDVCLAFEVERNGRCLLFETADFSGPCTPGTRQLFVSYRHVVDPNRTEATFHGFFEDTCILNDGSPLPSIGTLTEEACEATCLANTLCKAYEHHTSTNDCLLLVLAAENVTVTDQVEYTTSCPVTPVVTKLRAKTNPYRIQNQVDLGTENLLSGMVFDDKEVFECVALCDHHPFCRAFKYFIERRTCELYQQAREGYAALVIPETGVDVYVNVHAFVDVLSFLGPRGTPIASLAKLSYDECAAICHIHDACSSFTHSTKYRFNPYAAVANERRLITKPIATEPGGAEPDRFLLKFQVVDDEPEQGLVVKRLSYTNDAAFDRDVYLEQFIDQPSRGFVKFSKSNHCLKRTFSTTSRVTVNSQDFVQAVVGECTQNDFFNLVEDEDGFLTIDEFGDCLTYDDRPGLLGSDDHVLPVYWGDCSSPDATKFSWASPRFHISFEDPTTGDAVCLTSDLTFKDCRLVSNRTRWMYNFQNKQIMQSELFLKEELCLTIGSGSEIDKVPCDLLGPTEGRFVVEVDGRIVQDGTANCLTAGTGGEASVTLCESGPGANAAAQQLQRFGDFESCVLRSRGTSEIGVLSKNEEGDDAMRTSAVQGLPGPFYVEDPLNPNLLLVTYDYNRSVIIIVGYTAVDEPRVIDSGLGDTCITRIFNTEDLRAGPCINNSIPESPRALSGWEISEDDRVFSTPVASNTIILCRQPNGLAKQLDSTVCSYEDTRWVLAFRGDSSRGGSEYALEPGPVPELPEVPREVLFRLWLQSPDGRLVRSMISKIEIMGVLVDNTERQIEEATQALADANVFIGQLDTVSSTVASQAGSNSATAKVLADVLFPLKRVPYVGPVATVFNRVLDSGAKVLEKGKPKVQNAQKVFTRVGGAMNVLQDGMLSAFVLLRPPLDALNAVKQGLKNLQACAFFDGGKLKQDAVRGVIKKVISAVDFANAGMDSIRSSLEVINGVKPDIILNTGLRPMRSILGGMRPVTNIMRALGFIADVFTYPIRFKVPVIGRVNFRLLDVARTIGRVIGIIKSIPFVGWIVGWVEDAVDAAIRAIFGRISLPLPSFNRDFAGPVRRARDELIAARDRVIQQAQAIELELQGAFTGLIPGDIDFSVDIDVNNFIPDELSDLPCLSDECALQLPSVAPVADEIIEARDFIQNRLSTLDRSFLHSSLIEYLDSFAGCNESSTLRLQLAQFLPDNIRVDSCDLNEPSATMCLRPTFSRGDILENLTQTVQTLFEFTPSQRRMLRRALAACDGNYCFEAVALQIIGVESVLSLERAANFGIRRASGQLDVFPFSFSPVPGFILEFDVNFKVAADVSLKFVGENFVPEIDFDLQAVLIPKLTFEQVKKPWIVLNRLINEGEEVILTAQDDFRCKRDLEERIARRACARLEKLDKLWVSDNKWSKRNRLSVAVLSTLLVYPTGKDEPFPAAKLVIQNAANRQIVTLLRRHLHDITKLVNIARKRGQLEAARRTVLLQYPQRAFNFIRLTPWRPIEFDDGFFSVILRPDGPLHPDTTIENSILQTGNAVTFEFDLERIPVINEYTPRAMYIALAFPMNGALLLPGAPKPRIGISFGTRPLVEQVYCYSLRLSCSLQNSVNSATFSRFCERIRELCITDFSDRNDLLNRNFFKFAFAYGLGDPLRGKALGIV